jgi:hypothetical protein
LQERRHQWVDRLCRLLELLTDPLTVLVTEESSHALSYTRAMHRTLKRSPYARDVDFLFR